jgi:hypothetical protein
MQYETAQETMLLMLLPSWSFFLGKCSAGPKRFFEFEVELVQPSEYWRERDGMTLTIYVELYVDFMVLKLSF